MLYQNFFYSPHVDALFTNEATIDYMLQFEAKSQDVIDSATMVQAKESVIFIQKDLEIGINWLLILSENLQQTPMIGRSFMQQARPITFGFKVYTWLDRLSRSKERIERIL
jgi:3-carboxy-cis,cis-muconate cycloisomerase